MVRSFAPLGLDDVERRELTLLASRRSTAQGVALRARIVLACAEGERARSLLPVLVLIPTRSQVAPALRRASARWSLGRASIGDAAHHRGCPDRGGDRPHP